MSRQLQFAFSYCPPKYDDYEELERKYWKNITFIAPLYGADVCGSITDDTCDSWNINRLGSILDFVEQVSFTPIIILLMNCYLSPKMQNENVLRSTIYMLGSRQWPPFSQGSDLDPHVIKFQFFNGSGEGNRKRIYGLVNLITCVFF